MKEKVLNALKQHNGSSRVRVLASDCYTSNAEVMKTLFSLEEDGLVSRTEHFDLGNYEKWIEWKLI